MVSRECKLCWVVVMTDGIKVLALSVEALREERPWPRTGKHGFTFQLCYVQVE